MTIKEAQLISEAYAIIARHEHAKPFKLSVKTRVALARNLAVLRQTSAHAQEARDGLIRQYGENGEIKPGTPRFADFLDAANLLMNSDAEVKLEDITISDLNLDENDIPIDALSALPIILEK